jgi:hypothetical protein
VQRYWLPSIRAAIALGSGDWEGAVDALEQASLVEMGLVPPFEGGLLVPVYLRAMAYLAGKRGEDAAREFHRIVERPGLIKNFVLHPLAVLGEARALAMAGRTKESAAAYARFLETWKSADEGLAILADARREGSSLHK